MNKCKPKEKRATLVLDLSNFNLPSDLNDRRFAISQTITKFLSYANFTTIILESIRESKD
jgi:hypothetical protein